MLTVIKRIWNKHKSRKQMFDEYKVLVVYYTERCAEIEKHVLEAYTSYGDDLQGSLDWTPYDLKWKERTEEKLKKMAENLNLSEKERNQIP